MPPSNSFPPMHAWLVPAELRTNPWLLHLRSSRAHRWAVMGSVTSWDKIDLCLPTPKMASHAFQPSSLCRPSESGSASLRALRLRTDAGELISKRSVSRLKDATDIKEKSGLGQRSNRVERPNPTRRLLHCW